MDDHTWMKQAVTLGERGRISAPPNPWVGAIIVKNGQLVGKGFHEKVGEKHAEVLALEEALDNARDATLYITLEPCAHFGRTPPCTQAIIKSGIKRVVIGILDPDEKVSGKGIQELKDKGLEVTVLEDCEEVKNSLRPYLHHRIKKHPYCVAKAAISIDGRSAMQDGTSKWISTPSARVDAHRLRAESQAVIIGSQTALFDNPSLTVRDYPTRRQPLRVVIDSKGVTQTTLKLFDFEVAKTLIATVDTCKKIEEWKRAGAEVLTFSSESGHINLQHLLKELHKMGILQVLVEGGSRLLGAFLNQNLIDQYSIYIGSKIIGSQGVPLFSAVNFNTLDEAPKLKLIGSSHFDSSIRLDYII